MKGDFSRLSFDPKKHYNGVWMQQGRVQLDADWNEQIAILRHQLESQAADLIGGSGTPRHAPGFAIQVKNALSFDGINDFVEIRASRALAHIGTRDFTIELKLTPRPGATGTLLSRVGEHGEPRYTLSIESSGKATFLYHQESLTTSTALKLGHPHHLAVTRDGAHLRIFVDGVLSAEKTFYEKSAVEVALIEEPSGEIEILFRRALQEEDHDACLLLGAALRDGVRQDFFHGEIDAVQIWKHALTEHTLQRSLHHPPSPDAPGLVACFRFEEGEGDLTRDLVSRLHTGHLGGGDPDHSPDWLCRALWISAGRYYINGVLCENEQNTPLNTQPDYPDSGLSEDTQGLYIAYLDAWTRLITANEDPSLAEVALGGPDTTARTRVVWQVKLLPLHHPDERHQPHPGREWSELLYKNDSKGKLAARRAKGSVELLENTLYRVEIHNSGVCAGAPSHGLYVEQVLPQKSQIKLKDAFDPKAWPRGQWVELTSTPHQARQGALTRVIRADEKQRILTLESLPRAVAHERELYVKKIASFKWSRENAAVAYPVDSFTKQTLTLKDGAATHTLEVGVGDWLELQDEHRVLQGLAEPLAQITRIDARTLTLREEPERPLDTEKRPLIRRWDHNRLSASTGTLPLNHDWIELERGIEIRFDPQGEYHTGDYWLLPTRTATGDVDWPREHQAPSLQPPHGVYHHLSPLALLRFEGRGATLLHDYRQFFSTRHETPAQPFIPEDPQSYPPPKPPRPPTPAEAIPRGCMLLSESAHPPGGYHATGLHLDLPAPAPGWEERAPLPTQTPSHAVAVALHGSIFVFLESGEVWEYSPKEDLWAPRAPMTPRQGFGATALGHRIYVVGGLERDGAFSARVESYDPKSNKWTAHAPMLSPRGYAGVAALRGGVHVIGGRGHRFLRGAVPLRLHQRYDPQEDIWSERAPLPVASERLGVASLHNKLYAIGGRTKRWLGPYKAADQVYSYQMAQDRWQERAALLTPRWAMGVAVLCEEIYLSGGEREKELFALVEKFAPATDDISEVKPMSAERSAHSAAALDDKLFVIDGMRCATEEICFSKRLHIFRK